MGLEETEFGEIGRGFFLVAVGFDGFEVDLGGEHNVFVNMHERERKK